MPPTAAEVTKLVEMVEKVSEKLPAVEKELADLRAKVGGEDLKELVANLEKSGVTSIDLKALSERLDKAEAQHMLLVRHIHKSKGGAYFPGVEDGRGKFSMIRAAYAVRTNQWNEAPYEKEVFDETRPIMQKIGMWTGIDTEGGYFVPEQMLPEFNAAIYRNSVFLQLEGSEGSTRVQLLDGLTGAPVKINAFDGGAIVYWNYERGKYELTDAATGQVNMTPHKLTGAVKATEEQLRFGAPSLIRMTENDLARKMGMEIDRVIPYGSGIDNEPLGFVKRALSDQPRSVQFFQAETGAVVDPNTPVADSQGGELTFDKLMEMQGALEDIDIIVLPSAAFISAPRFWRRRKKDKILNFSSQVEGEPYLLGGPFLSDAALTGVIGPWDKTTMVPTNNKPGASAGWETTSSDLKYGDVFYGNWEEVFFARWGGLEFVRTDGTGPGFWTDERFTKVRMWCDNGIRQGQAIVICPDAQMRD